MANTCNHDHAPLTQISCAECDKPICEVAVAANAATVH